MITLDKVSIQKFREQGVREIFVHFIQKGCEGNKIEVLTEIPTHLPLVGFETPELTIFCLENESTKLSEARLTQVGEKWIFTSKQVTGRCGCGSSFRFADDPIKTPKEFAHMHLLEAGTTHTIEHGDYFVYGSGTTEITVTGRARIYTLEISKISEIIIHISQEQAEAQLYSIVIGDKSLEQTYTSRGNISGKNLKYVHGALILVSEADKITAKIGASVAPGCMNYDVNIYESAVLLGTTGSVRGIPELRVASDDGKASHSATMERISGDMLVYLASRGISLELAKKIYLSARIAQTYAGLPEKTIQFLEQQIFTTLGI